MNRYAIVSEYIGASEPATLDEIREIVGETWGAEFEGWTLDVRERNDEVRLYAESGDDSAEASRAFSHGWTEVTSELYYHVIGRLS